MAARTTSAPATRSAMAADERGRGECDLDQHRDVEKSRPVGSRSTPADTRQKHAVRHRSGTAKGAGARSIATAERSASTAEKKHGRSGRRVREHRHVQKERPVGFGSTPARAHAENGGGEPSGHGAWRKHGRDTSACAKKGGARVTCASIETGSSSSRKRSGAGLTCEQEAHVFCGVQAVCQCSSDRGEADGAYDPVRTASIPACPPLGRSCVGDNAQPPIHHSGQRETCARVRDNSTGAHGPGEGKAHGPGSSAAFCCRFERGEGTTPDWSGARRAWPTLEIEEFLKGHNAFKRAKLLVRSLS